MIFLNWRIQQYQRGEYLHSRQNEINKTNLNEKKQKKGTIKNNSASASGSQKVVYLLVLLLSYKSLPK